MSKPKYVKPQVQSLDRTLAVSMGGCATGKTPGTCGGPGYSAGTCASGDEAGIPVGPPCNPFGNFALGGCSTGENAFAAGCGSVGHHANAPDPT